MYTTNPIATSKMYSLISIFLLLDASDPEPLPPDRMPFTKPS